MRLTIIIGDSAVYKDGLAYANLTWSGTPENVHALQWFGSNGWIEYNDGKANKNITALPDWANNAAAAWDVANTPVPPPSPNLQIPTVVSMRQARLALYDAGLLDIVDESIALMPIEEQRRKAQIEWEFAQTVARESALVYGLAGALGLTDEMLDDLFVKAATL